MRVGALALAVAAALGVSACGDDDNGGGGNATVTVTQTSSTPAQPTLGETTTAAPTTVAGANRCPDVVITPNSGDGVFDITTENLTCAEAEALLRSEGLRAWNCRVIAEGQGRRTTSCTSGDKVLVFATEA